MTNSSAPDTPSYPALLRRGRCHRLLGAFDEAIADFTQAHELRLGAARPLFERGAIFILIGHYEESLADYEAAAALEPSYPGSASYFAELFLYTDRADEALAISERARHDEPTDLVHRVNTAHAHLLLGHIDHAAQEYETIAGQHDTGGITGAAIVLNDLAIMRSAGIDVPGTRRVERRLTESRRTL